MDELNKSCDRCGLKKRKCSGEKPCRRCVKSRAVCTYSRRRPRAPSRRLEAFRAQGSTSHTLLEGHPRPTLTRPKLRASPATGLVGMQENTFLCDFFASMGFMPLATPSDIREAMIKIIMPSALQQSAAMHDCGEEENLETIIPRRRVGDAVPPADPSACTFWCAVAIGALVKGRPVQLAVNYLQLARNAVARFSGQASTEMAKAWTILSKLYGLMGDQPKFHEYLELAHSFLRDSVGQGTIDMLPVGLAEIITVGDTVKLFDEDIGSERTESLLNEDVPSPQLGQVTTEGELCRHIFQSARVFEQTIRADILVRRRRTIGYQYLGEAEHTDPEIGASRENASASERSGSTRPVLVPHDITELVPNISSSAAFDRMATMLDFRRLEEAVESPIVGSGIGGLVISDRLMYEKAARGDTRGVLESVERCVEIYERYPGLNRFSMRAHKTHIIIVMLVALAIPPAKELYNRLRAAFNLTPPPGFLPVPAWEDWRGVSAFCDKEACTSVEALLTCEDTASTASSPSLTRATDGEQLEGAQPTDIMQGGPNISASCSFALPSHEEASAFMGDSPVTEQTVPTITSDESLRHAGTNALPIGDSRRDVCGGNVATRGEEESYPDLFAPESAASLVSLEPVQTLNDEPDEERVVAEDWLDAVHVLGLRDTDGAFV